MELPVSIIEGIGKVYAAKLKKEKKVDTLTDFIEFGIGKALKEDSLKGRYGDWLKQAILFLIPGIGKDDAEVLVKNKVSVNSLDDRSPATILGYFAKGRTKKLNKRIPDLETIRKWQIAAAKIASTPIIVLTVSGRDDQVKFEDFKVSMAGKDFDMDSKGKAVICGIPHWRLAGKVCFKDQHVGFLRLQDTGQYRVLRRRYMRELSGKPRPATLFDANIRLFEGERLQFVNKKLADFEEGSVFFGKKSKKGPTSLLAAKYAVVGDTRIYDVVHDVDTKIESGKKYVIQNHKVVGMR